MNRCVRLWTGDDRPWRRTYLVPQPGVAIPFDAST
jgi:hypothetical protein